MNNSKQTVLSIVGIAILVIAVVGVSFAFFTYSRTGQANNIITTGSITFNSNVAAYDGVSAANPLTLTNQFPQRDADGKTNVNDGSGGTAYVFTVTGQIPETANSVYYGAFLEESTPTDQASDTQHRFPYGQISIYVTDNGDSNNNTNVVTRFSTGNYKLTQKVTKGVQGHPNGELIAYGTITNSGVSQTHTYTMTMWVNDTVKISDTNNSAEYQYRASSTSVGDKPAGVETDNRYVYSDMWYAVKVNIQASDPLNNPTVYSSLASSAS